MVTLFFVTATAQLKDTAPLVAKHWTTENGLPQNTINAIVQTPDGYLWVGTFGGLARFDGVQFTVFNTSNTSALKSNRITALHVSREGKLWIGTDTCEAYYYSNGEFRYFATVGTGTRYNFIQTIYQDKKGALNFGTVSGMTRYKNQNNPQPEHFDQTNGLPDNGVTSICEDNEGVLWLATSGGLATLHNNQIVVSKGFASTTDGQLRQILPRADGGVWFNTLKGVGYYQNNHYTMSQKFAGNPPSAAALLTGRTFGVCASYRSGQILQETSRRFMARPTSIQESFPTQSLFEDASDNLWLGTIGNGLYRISLRHITILPVHQEDHLISPSTIIQDHQSNTWLGTGNGLYRLSAGRITTYFRNKVPPWNISALYVAKDNTLWIGHTNGIARYQQGKFTEYAYPPLELVTAITEDQKGQIWLGTPNGLVRFLDGQFTFYTTREGLIHSIVKSILVVRDGSLWIGTVKGLSHFKDGTFQNFTTREGLSNDYIRDIYEDEDGALWLATYGGGLNRWQHGVFTALTTKNGLGDDFISRILVDEKKQFWLLGNRGIFCLDYQHANDFLIGKSKMLFCKIFGMADGLDVSEGNGGSYPAGWRMQNGQLWFPMLQGVAIVNPYTSQLSPPQVAIERIVLDQASQDLFYPIEISPGKDNVEIQYTGIDLTKPEQVQFKYKLEGFDKDWIVAGTRRTALYSQLPPGDYVFRLIAATPDTGWSLQEATATFHVTPHFWQTRWFRLLLGLSVLSLLYLGYRWRLAQWQRRTAQQELFARQLIASQEEDRQRIALEMHDGLSQSLVIIKRRAFACLQAVKDSEIAHEQLQEIAEASNYALDEVKEIIFALRPRQLDRLGVSEAISELLNRVSAVNGWQLTKALDNLDGALSKADENNLYRLVQEALNNISKHAAATQVNVQISRKSKSLELIIMDNGCGFVVQIYTSESARSLGLQSIVERTKLLAGQVAIRSVPGVGTTIRLQLPIKEHYEEI